MKPRSVSLALRILQALAFCSALFAANQVDASPLEAYVTPLNAKALLNSSIVYAVTSYNDNVTRGGTTALVTRLDNFGAERRPVVVLMPGWGGVGDVAAVRDAQALMFANAGYVALNIGFHQTSDVPSGALASWYSDLAESAKAALDTLCEQAYADCSAIVLIGESYGGTQTHPVVRFLRASGAYDGSGGANAGRKVVGMLGQDSGYSLYWAAPVDADATAYSIAMIQNLGDGDFPVDSCNFGNCGARNRADYHQAAAGNQYVLSYCPAGGAHGSRGYADWDAWVLSAVKTMLHNQRGVARFTGYVEPTIAVSNACLSAPALPGAPTIGTATAGNASISVAFAPGAPGSGTLVRYTVDCSGVTNTGISSPITVNGLTNGTAYTCRVRTTSTVGDSAWSAPSNQVTPGPSAFALTPNPTSVAFGGQSINTTAPVQMVTLTNSGSGAVTVSSITASANFGVTHNCATVNASANCTANVSFTPTAEGALNGTLTVTSSAGIQTVPLTGTGEKSLVTHYYYSILRRAPEAGGKAFWESEAVRMQGLGVNVNETWYAMAQFFFFSAEYTAFNRDDTGFVTDLYKTFFNRDPDAGGLAYWTGQIAQGMPREVVLTGFMFSQEFISFTQAIFGNTAARAEVDMVVNFYRGLLARLPDDGGFANWVGLFRTAQCAGAQAGGQVYARVESISFSFADSLEYRGKSRTNAQFVGDLYNALLRRGGDLAGVQSWINQLNAGATRDSIRRAFISTVEFNTNANAIVNQGCMP